MADLPICHHLSMANGLHDRPEDLPYLLRRVADAIEARGLTPYDILDVTVSFELTDDAVHWWSATVYFWQSRNGTADTGPSATDREATSPS